ncbi:hypothetical protein [Bacillus suaedaesalsae]|uniref:Uncharacterized protein n=1 Tax=Bacillus suaedaesalsae TaxID=2810349 RepID=A0ABS2DG10_9BACI|nr:hypothetical protein [Bacillus suaedaesalsae]MBM6617424.1 hypothetical protein [Bacillus suaedaesalsae]
MAHLFTGSALLITALLLFLIDRYYPYVDFMSSFSAKGFRRLVGGLVVTGILLLSFGVYSYITYQPPFMKIAIEGNTYFVEGEIDKVAYVQEATEVYKVSEKGAIKVVLWEAVEGSNLTIDLVRKKGTLMTTSEIEKMEDSISSKIVNKLEAKALYQFPLMVDEAGEWKVTVKEKENVIGSFYIKVSP